jgi:hypothetical protein
MSGKKASGSFLTRMVKKLKRVEIAQLAAFQHLWLASAAGTTD